MTDDKKQQKTALVQAIEAQERPVHIEPVNGFFGLGEKPIHSIAFRVNTKGEQDKAIIGAHAYAAEKTKNVPGAAAAAQDADLITDAKNIHALFRACRDPENVKYPVFTGGPEWMREHLTTDQIAVLLHAHNTWSAKISPLWTEIDKGRVIALARACSSTASTDIPEMLLKQADREWLAQAFVLLAMHCAELSDWDKTLELSQETDGVDSDG